MDLPIELHSLDKGSRIELIDECQRIIWHDNDTIPEVAMQPAYVLVTCSTSDELAIELTKQLRQLDATPSWSDVRPTEECAICHEDFDTRKWHRVLTISLESGPQENPKIHDAWYPARFCNKCVPTAAPSASFK